MQARSLGRGTRPNKLWRLKTRKGDTKEPQKTQKGAEFLFPDLTFFDRKAAHFLDSFLANSLMELDLQGNSLSENQDVMLWRHKSECPILLAIVSKNDEIKGLERKLTNPKVRSAITPGF